jgi:hypothetical protein
LFLDLSPAQQKALVFVLDRFYNRGIVNPAYDAPVPLNLQPWRGWQKTLSRLGLIIDRVDLLGIDLLEIAPLPHVKLCCHKSLV